MEELIKKLQANHGLSAEQSQGILNTIAGFIKEKFPMVGGAIDNLFQSGTTPSAPGTTPSDAQTSARSTQGNDDLLDKINDFIPGDTEQKMENFANGFFGKKK